VNTVSNITVSVEKLSLVFFSVIKPTSLRHAINGRDNENMMTTSNLKMKMFFVITLLINFYSLQKYKNMKALKMLGLLINLSLICGKHCFNQLLIKSCSFVDFVLISCRCFYSCSRRIHRYHLFVQKRHARLAAFQAVHLI